MLQAIALEALGFTFPCLFTYAISLFIPLAPISPTWISSPTLLKFLHSYHPISLGFIPSFIYLLGRIYYEINEFISIKLPQLPTFRRILFPHAVKDETELSRERSHYYRNFMIFLSIFGPFAYKPLQQFLWDYFNEVTGHITSMVYELSEPEVIKAVELGKKIAVLIVGWFLLFLVVELALRVVFFVLISAYNSLWVGNNNKKVVRRIVKMKQQVDADEKEEKEGSGEEEEPEGEKKEKANEERDKKND